MKTNSNNLQVKTQLQQVEYSESTEAGLSTVDLELIMTNSAYGYEYASCALSEGDVRVGGPELYHLQAQIEQFKENYFSARQLLQRRDATRLSEFERDLQMQKCEIFSKSQSYLH